MKVILSWKEHYYATCWVLDIIKDYVCQYKNWCEMYITIVKIESLHAHSNYLAEKCPIHIAKIILSSKIFSVIWLIKQSYFPVTFISMKPIREMNMKLLLFNLHVFLGVKMRTALIIKTFTRFLFTCRTLLVTSFTK